MGSSRSAEAVIPECWGGVYREAIGRIVEYGTADRWEVGR